MDKNYELFIEQLTNAIHETTDIPLGNIKFVKKDGGDRLNIIFAEHDDAYEVCSIHVSELFAEYQNDANSFGAIVKHICDDIVNAKNSNMHHKIGELTDYETAKSRLFVRLINYDRNIDILTNILQNVVYKTLDDIAFVVCAILDEREDNFISTKILKSMVKKWGKNEDDIFNEAIENTYRMSPPRFYMLEKILLNNNYSGDSFMNSDDTFQLNDRFVGNLLSTTRQINGAIAVFLPGVAEKISEMLKSDFYMVFTSIHEVMIHSTKSGVDPSDLKNVLKSTIAEATQARDYLTEKIYKYNRKTHKFECVLD